MQIHLQLELLMAQTYKVQTDIHHFGKKKRYRSRKTKNGPSNNTHCETNQILNQI